jgi:hypothetical protein
MAMRYQEIFMENVVRRFDAEMAARAGGGDM